MADPTTKERKAYAKSGWAMPDGSYYIRPGNPQDLTNAIQAVGRASGDDNTSDESQRNAVRKHIIKRATALGKENLIPPTWSADGSLKGPVKHSGLAIDPEELEHFGRKGMHWGQHIFGRERKPASPESEKTHEIKTQAKKEGVHTLSNEELQTAITRMNLEAQFSNLSGKEKGKVDVGRDFVKGVTSDVKTVADVGNTAVGAYNTATTVYSTYQKLKPLMDKATA